MSSNLLQKIHTGHQSPNLSPDLQADVVPRVPVGASISALHAECNIYRCVLYGWHDPCRQEGVAGLLKPVRPPPRQPPTPAYPATPRRPRSSALLPWSAKSHNWCWRMIL